MLGNWKAFNRADILVRLGAWTVVTHLAVLCQIYFSDVGDNKENYRWAKKYMYDEKTSCYYLIYF